MFLIIILIKITCIMNVRSIFKSVLFIILISFNLAKPIKNRSDFLNDLSMLGIDGINPVHCFQEASYISDQEVFVCVRNSLLARIDSVDNGLLLRIFNIFESAQREGQSLASQIYKGLMAVCCFKMIFAFKDEIAKKFSSKIPEGDTARQEKEMIELFSDIVLKNDVSQFCNFLQYCTKVEKIELQTMEMRQSIGNLGVFFIDVLLNSFFESKDIKGIDKMACALLGSCLDSTKNLFQSVVFSQLEEHFLDRIKSYNFPSIEFPVEAEKLASAFSSAKKPHMCFICRSPMILFVGAPNCNPSSLCHPYCLNQGCCPFCRGISGITCRSPRARETLPTLESRPHSGSRTVARPNPKKTRGVSVAPAARRSPSPSRVGIRGIQSRQGRGLPRVGA